MAISLGRLTSAFLEQLRSPGAGLEDVLQVGSSTAQLAATVARARRDIVGPSWLLIFLLISAEGAMGATPIDSGADLFGDLADGAAVVGVTLISVLVALMAYEKWLPRLRVGLPQPLPAPLLGSTAPHEPWWKTRELGLGASWP
ncbi:MAG TPA: hypothetical protein VGB42_01610 [Candidatus Thermoplasmatota archaeon]